MSLSSAVVFLTTIDASFVLTKEGRAAEFLLFYLFLCHYTSLQVGEPAPFLPQPLTSMAPHKQSSSGGGHHHVGFGSGGKTNGLYQPPSAAAKKPNMQLIQADHELFLQAFESESQLSPSCMCKDAHLRAYFSNTGSFTLAMQL